MKHIKKLLSAIIALTLILSMHSGCGMFTNYKAIAEQALEDKYGEEFICHDTWDEGGDSFRAKCSSADNQNIKFSTLVSIDKTVIDDKYIERAVALQCIDIISPYLNDISSEYVYYSSINSQSHLFTDTSDIDVIDFFTRTDNPILYCIICFNQDSKVQNEFVDEYSIILDIINILSQYSIDDVFLGLYFVPQDAIIEYKEYFNNVIGVTPSIDILKYSNNVIDISASNGIIAISEDEYITKREQMTYEQ